MCNAHSKHQQIPVRHRHHETENGIRGPNPPTQYARNPACCLDQGISSSRMFFFLRKKNLLLFENSELNKAGTNRDSRKFGRGGAIVWQKLRLRKISFQIFWRLVNTSFNLSECVSGPVFETDSNCNAASCCSQNPLETPYSEVWLLLVIGIYMLRLRSNMGNWNSEEVEIFKDLAPSDCRPTV